MKLFSDNFALLAGFLQTGVSDKNSAYLNGKIKLSNQIALVLLFLGIIYAIISFVYFSPILAIFPASASIIAGTAVFLNSRHLYYPARFILGIGALTACSLYHALLTSEHSPIIPSLYFVSFGFALNPWVLADIREKNLLYPTVLICMVILASQFWLNRQLPLLTASEIPLYQDTAIDWLTYAAAGMVFFTTMLFLQKKNFAMERERDQALGQVQQHYAEEKDSRLAAEEHSQKLEEQLLQAKKIEALGRLTGGVAHDLNNMMTPILGYAELLLIKLEPSSPESNYVKAIYKAGNSAKKVVSQLLAFSRKQALVVKPLSIIQLLEKFKPLLQHTLRENIELIFISESELPTILVDQNQFEQVILNLAINAQDAMPDGGRLSIETKQANLDGVFYGHIPGFKPGNYVQMAVSDNGSGMDNEELQNIFDPFYTTKKKLGTGLGLSTVHGIVKQHGGQIKVYSEKGIGSTFKVYWPITNEHPSPLHEQKPSAVELTFRGTVMLVEDDPEVCQLIEIQLKDRGLSVLTALSGEAALSILEEHNYNVDLLLTDVIMKGMNGKQLYEKISLKNPAIKVIFMSGYTDNVIAEHGIMKDGVRLLQKPFNQLELSSLLQLVLRSEG